MTKDIEASSPTSDFGQQQQEPEILTTNNSRYASLSGQQRQRSSSGNGLELSNKMVTTTTDKNGNSNRGLRLTSTSNIQVTKSIDEYELKGVIGYGSSAAVYSALDTSQNIRVAIKMIDLDMFERNQIDELRRETALMALSKHENILPVYSSFVSGSKLYIVTPYLAGGSCLDIMKTAFPEGLDELSIATILKQALEGICYLHKNGHIHRDVKSGNLLVDEDGSVLLGDFGVSSSLMDGERGLRKTFVGTPCWMAPEVMEQAGYDYKADIWSFGITAIELATGQAPFAKLPPLKVLLMTLSNDPPTLMRETTKHKYSKIFKDMIDLCLCKDPSNRPTAEKLLLHPFFKQARKKDYLVKNILLGLPPLERRPRKGVHRRQRSFTTSDEWDFNDNDNDGENGDDDGDDNGNGNDYLKSVNDAGALYDYSNKNINNNTTNTSSKCLNTNDNKMGIIDTSPPTCHHDYVPPRDPVSLPKPKRHISFGHVIVRNPPQPSTSLSSSQPIYSATSGPSLTQDVTPSTNLSVDSDPTTDGSTKKATNIDNFSSTSMKYPIYGEDTDYQDGKVKNFGAAKSSSRVSNNDEAYPIYHLTKTESSESAGERRSRFEVHHGQDPIMVPLSATNNALFPPTSVSSHFHAHDSLSSTSSSSTSANEIPAKETSIKTSTPPTSSNQHACDSKDMTGSSSSSNSSSGTGGSCEPRKVGRFELTTKAATTTVNSIPDSSSSGRNSLEHHPSAMSLPSPTNSLPLHNSSNNSIHHSITMASSGSHQHHASDASNSSYSTTPPHSCSTATATATASKSTTSSAATALLQSHLKELIRNNDAQRHLIEDIFGTMQSQRSHQQKHLYSSSANEDDMTSMIESLEKQLCRIGNENSALRMENVQLRKELDLVRFV